MKKRYLWLKEPDSRPVLALITAVHPKGVVSLSQPVIKIVTPSSFSLNGWGLRTPGTAGCQEDGRIYDDDSRDAPTIPVDGNNPYHLTAADNHH